MVEPVVVLGAAKAHEQVAGGEEAHRDVVQACEASDGDGEVGLAASDVAVEDEVLGVLDELEALELATPPVGGHFETAPVVAVQALGGGESGLADQAGFAGAGALFELKAEPCLDQVEVGGGGIGHDFA